MRIKEVKARKIINSKNDETIEVQVKSDDYIGIGSVGSGTSKSKFEVVDYPKKGVDFVVDFFNKNIKKELEKMQINSFSDLDKVERVFNAKDVKMDKLGGNVIVATEFAILKAISKDRVWEFLGKAKKMPMPLGNCIGGGKHAINGPDFQEFLLLPKTKKFNEAVFANNQIYNIMEKELKRHDKTFFGRKTFENAWCPNLNNVKILDILNKFAQRIAKQYKIEIKLGIDVAASEIWNGRKYQYKKFARFREKRALSKEMQIKYIEKLMNNYDLLYVEDPLHEEDFDGFRELNKKLCFICGDDLIATNIERLDKAIEGKIISAVIVKPNQIGSLIKTKKLVDYARKNRLITVMSHRSGETNDNIIAHLAVGWNMPIIKTGISGGERISKLNELIRINEVL